MISPQNIKDYEELCQKTKETVLPGPWTDEVNRVEFTHLGYRCLLTRNPFLLNWCGYVEIPEDHPYYDYPTPYELDLDVHGGITYGSSCSHWVGYTTDLENSASYWLGFDCAHYNDIVPIVVFQNSNDLLKGMEDVIQVDKSKFLHPWEYRTMRYAMKETRKLARQLREIHPG